MTPLTTRIPTPRRGLSLILHLCDDALQGVVVRGRLVTKRGAVPLDREEWARAWDNELAPFDEPLAALVEELGGAMSLRRCPVTLVYNSPTSTATVLSSPAAGDLALDAAELALADQFPDPLDESPYAVVLLGRDAAESSEAQSHTLAVAETEAASSAMEGWLARAGLGASGGLRLVPAEGVAIARAVERRLADPSEDPRIDLRVGEHVSTLVASALGRVTIIRPSSFTLGALVDALTSPLPRAGAEDVVLPPAQARAVLCEHGIPEPEDHLDFGSGLTGRDVLPVLQPVLQRGIVELRQSVRFGLGAHAADASLHVSGRGAETPRLAALLARQANLNACHTSWDDLACDIDTALDCRALPKLALPSRAAAHRRHQRRALTAAYAGLAVACVVGVASFFASRAQADGARDQLAGLQQRAALLEQIDAEREAIVRELSVLGAAERAAMDACGVKPAWTATLAHLAQHAADSVLITSIRAASIDESHELEFEAAVLPSSADSSESPDAAPPANAADPARAVNDFLARLEASPLIEAAELGSTRRVVVAGSETRSFSVSLTLRAMLCPTVIAEVQP